MRFKFSYFLLPIQYFFADLLTLFINLFIWRNRHIVLVGAWFGRRFAGNSRFLFQYLSEHKDEYGLKRVIWVTRDPKIADELNKLGYEAYMMHSVKGIYYHFKAGIHIICTMPSTSIGSGKKLPGDIMGYFSMGARRINLTHSIGWTKEYGGSGKSNKYGTFGRIIADLFTNLKKVGFFNAFFLYPGDWGRCDVIFPDEKYIATIMDPGIKPVITGIPNLCPCLKYTSDEQTFLDRLKEYDTIILYTPTYRSTEKIWYKNPLNDQRFCEFLKNNKLLWLEKLHPDARDNMKAEKYDPECAISLDSDFDLNLFARDVDVMVTDYSTTYEKGVYYKKANLFYTPDYDEYLKYDNGLKQQFIDYISERKCDNVEELIDQLTRCLDPEGYQSIVEKDSERRKTSFDDDKMNYEAICNDLFGAIKP